jgi:serpin B
MRLSVLRHCLAGIVLLSSSMALAAEAPKKVDMAQSSFDFATQLYQRYSAGNKPENLIFSPASIHLAMTMTSAGAAGNTLKQMESVLALPGGDATHKAYAMLTNDLLGGAKKPFEFSLSNNLWLQKDYPVQPAFSQTLTKSYRAAVTPLDFIGNPNAARATINDAVAKQTHDKIKDLLSPDAITPMTRLILTNAVYFKAAWADAFEENATKQEPFHSLDGKDDPAAMMHKTERMGYFENDQLQMVELPYEGRQLSMLVVLPKSDRLEALANVEQSLPDLTKWSAGLRGKRVNLAMPKFKFESQLALGADLEAMGMTDAFTNKADFSRLTTQEKLYISAVIHKAFIDVNEAGTEAAAATAVSISAMSMPMHEAPVDFIANRPFVFAIRHNQTGVILFLGRVARP